MGTPANRLSAQIGHRGENGIQQPESKIIMIFFYCTEKLRKRTQLCLKYSTNWIQQPENKKKNTKKLFL